MNKESRLVIQEHGLAGRIVREMVGDGEFRSSLVNELHELIAFLQTRLSEAGSMQILGGSHSLLEPILPATLTQWLQVQADSYLATCHDDAGTCVALTSWHTKDHPWQRGYMTNLHVRICCSVCAVISCCSVSQWHGSTPDCRVAQGYQVVPGIKH